jgi:hypothetical protein
VRGSVEERRFIGFYLEGDKVLAVMGLNRGGDPELDEDGELFVAKALVRSRSAVTPSSLSDEQVDLAELATKTLR